MRSQAAGGLFVCADRVGREGKTTFCGCSCVIPLAGGWPAAPAGLLGIIEPGLLLAESSVEREPPRPATVAAGKRAWDEQPEEEDEEAEEVDGNSHGENDR